MDQNHHYLMQKSGVFYFSRRVPSNLQHHFQRQRFVRCLHTRSKLKAHKLSKELSIRLENIWGRQRLEHITSNRQVFGRTFTVRNFNGRFRDEPLNGKIFYSLRAAQIIIEEWIKPVNTKKPHSAIGYLPPPQRQSFQWTRGQSCNNHRLRPIKWG